eukprot:1138003-Rhodomonas_salina.1
MHPRLERRGVHLVLPECTPRGQRDARRLRDRRDAMTRGEMLWKRGERRCDGGRGRRREGKKEGVQ